VWEWAFKLFLGTGPFVLGAAWIHLTAMNAMLLQHDKEIALLKLQVGLRTRTPTTLPASSEDTTAAAAVTHSRPAIIPAPVAAPRLALTPNPETP
jgi:hypothetical protein